MPHIDRIDVTSALDSKKTGTFNANVAWTNKSPAYADIASWFENANNTAASMSVGDKLTASTLISDVGKFVSIFTNIRNIKYVQQYTKITLNSSGGQIGSEVITESTTTNKGILSSTGASKGGVTYKPSITAANSNIASGKKATDEDITALINDAVTKWTNNYNSTVTLTYNRGQVKWTNHSQRGRR